ncbi:MAG: glycosyltransferase [Gemmatimonadetes bacterium]|nr:glycosyltransferase [Gemmatimonadota bacterium]
MSSPTFLLTPVGSSGDVHPFVGIGKALADRGHDVVIATSEPFRDLIEKAGLRFIAGITREEYDEIMADPDLWHPRKGLKLVLRSVGSHLRGAYDRLTEICDPETTVLVGHSLAFAARVFEETHKVRAATIHLAPPAFRSLISPMAHAPGKDMGRLPMWLKRATMAMVDRLLIDPHIVPGLNALRRDLGLAPVSRPFKDWIHSPRLTLGLFPSWFCEPQPDWPKTVRLTGFPLFDEDDQHAASPELETFLEAGDPPIVFTPGSAHRYAGQFFAAAIDATTHLQRRALLLTRYAEQLPEVLPSHVRHESYVPLGRLLPRCAAIVHHGGIGTTAQGFAAGIPQLTWPLGFDQPDNSTRLKRLGVGGWVVPRQFTGSRVAAALQRLLTDESVARSCRRWQARMAEDDPVRDTCELLEGLAAGD